VGPFQAISAGVRPLSDVSPCGAWPRNAQHFAWYDAAPDAFRGRIASELLSYHDPARLIQAKTVGQTLENRPLVALRFGSNTRSANVLTPTVFVVGTHHAREWITEEVMMRLVRHYVNNARGTGGDPSLQGVFANVDLVMIPVANPDGYQYSRDGHRDWRKNRRSTCPSDLTKTGVDINRNYAPQLLSPNVTPPRATVVTTPTLGQTSFPNARPRSSPTSSTEAASATTATQRRGPASIRT
jgi:murein tripeptide amidase MpaA